MEKPTVPEIGTERRLRFDAMRMIKPREGDDLSEIAYTDEDRAEAACSED